jgi:hypothetical protein
MSDSVSTMAHMVNHRVADIEVSRQIEQQKEQRLEAIKAHCRTLEGESLWAMQQHYPELFTNNEEGIK